MQTRRRILLFVAVLAVICLAFPQTALADQLIFNGNFKDNANRWDTVALNRNTSVGWHGAGFTEPGSIHFSVPGRRAKGSARATQKINVRIQAGSRGKIELAWKKNWTGLLPAQQRIFVDLIKPDKSVVTVWAERTLLNDNTWVTASVDISEHLNQTGFYRLSMGAEFENGNSTTCQSQAWFDDVKLDISSGVDSKPKTSFLNPTGATKIAGQEFAVNGIAIDDAGVTRVEVLIQRMADNSCWNGNSWVKHEFWDNAKITTTAADRRNVTWSYHWPLPTSDGAFFRIKARATDITGNQELTSASNLVSVDNVGPVGNIFIEDAATYTNHRKVKIDVAVLGAVEMRFSRDNGRTWGPWEGFAKTKELELPAGNGAKIVTSQYKDDIGNTYQVSDSIVLDTTPPVTKRVFPASGATKVPSGSSIGVVFYENMDPLSFKNTGSEFSSSFYIKQGTRWVTAAVSFDTKTRSAKLVPTDELEPGTAYTVYLNEGIRDAAGNPLAANYTWNFTTSGAYSSSSKGSIGPEGGKVEGKGQMITLDVPPKALVASVNLTIEEVKDRDVSGMAGITRYSPIFKLVPQNLPLINPATVKVKYNPTEVPDPMSLRLIFYNQQQKRWDLVANASIDLVNNQVIAPMDNLATVTLVSQGDSAPPVSTIVSPTGADELGGRAHTIYGVSTDNMGIEKVEVLIAKQGEIGFFNGTDWQDTEFWIKADIISGKGQKRAAWSYVWRLPEDRYSAYKIKVRSTDTNQNTQASPAVVPVKLTGN